MRFKFHKVLVKKRFPLAISRGIRGDAFNLFISYEKDGIIGWGEAVPGKNEMARNIKAVKKNLKILIKNEVENKPPKELNQIYKSFGLAPCATAAFDMAIWDWNAKKAGLPLNKYLKIPLPSVPTSITLGINPPEEVKRRIPLLLDNTSIKSLKVKLGSSNGIEADKEMFTQVLESLKKYKVNLRVDANGGWKTPDAILMMKWLAERGVDYIEQPLEEGNEEDLKYIYPSRPLPIYIDESCRYSKDVYKWAPNVDGVNIKLMKCGGITEAIEIIKAAKKCQLKTMIGCMSESSVAIAAAASISGAIDHIDLDSHINLDPDPSLGVKLVNGITTPEFTPGHGAKLKPEYYA